ncbi:hypothetical protein GCM10027610_058750 [Dactylosporangium cerinum]
MPEAGFRGGSGKRLHQVELHAKRVPSVSCATGQYVVAQKPEPRAAVNGVQSYCDSVVVGGVRRRDFPCVTADGRRIHRRIPLCTVSGNRPAGGAAR